MIPCTTCNRHYRIDDAACPFCARPSGAKRAMQSLGAAMTTLVLAACYGGSDFGKYDTAFDSGGTGDTSDNTTSETTTETGTSETGTTDTGTTDTGTTTNDTAYTTETGYPTDTGSTTDSGVTSTDTDTTPTTTTPSATTDSGL